LIIGASMGGIRAVLQASDPDTNVILVAKGAPCSDGASPWMAGNGFQAALYPPDSFENHVRVS
jgi:succinate dehydrogenase/fumarate reductase flavoprotein subunit